VYTETCAGELVIKNQSLTHAIKNVFLLCSHPIVFGFKCISVALGDDNLIQPQEEITLPINFRACLSGLINVRFMMRYEVAEPAKSEEQVDSEAKLAEMPLTCKHRFQRMILFINSNFAFNIVPHIHLSMRNTD
jgi:hypothetical protein